MGFDERGRTQNCSQEGSIVMNLQNIPDELKSLKQWVCSTSNSKVPMMATQYRAASSIDPTTWGTFEEATLSVECGNYDSVGFVFNDNGIVGIDIDAGFDDDGFITELSADIISKCRSYTEKSRSGRGFHILLKGTLPFKGKNNRNGVEIYQASRYFIMTGDTFLYDEIIENQEAIDYVINMHFSLVHKENSSSKCDISNKIYTPEWTKPSDGIVKLRPNYPRIPDGCRNISLTSLAGVLHNQGYDKKQILEELNYCNKVACEPTLLEREITNIVNSVIRYKR